MPGLLSAARLPQQSEIKMLVIKLLVIKMLVIKMSEIKMFFVHLCRLQNLFKHTKFDHTFGRQCNTRSNLKLVVVTTIYFWTCMPCLCCITRQGPFFFFLFFFIGARPKDTKRYSRRTSWILPPPSIQSTSSEQLFLACNTFTATFH